MLACYHAFTINSGNSNSFLYKADGIMLSASRKMRHFTAIMYKNLVLCYSLTFEVKRAYRLKGSLKLSDSCALLLNIQYLSACIALKNISSNTIFPFIILMTSWLIF